MIVTVDIKRFAWKITDHYQQQLHIHQGTGSSALDHKFETVAYLYSKMDYIEVICTSFRLKPKRPTLKFPLHGSCL